MKELRSPNEQATHVNTFSGRNTPDIFYKYFPVEAWLPDLLEGKSLLFSSRTSFNDPFDCRPAFRLRSTETAVKFFQKKLRQHGLSSAKSLLAAKEGVRRAGADPNLMALHTQKILDDTGVLCLATQWDNALMWSHYAKLHKGIAVGFHSNVDVFRTAQPVIYTDELPKILVPVNEDPDLFFDTFQKKASCWSYEDEWRVVKPKLNIAQQDFLFREQVCFTTVDEARSLSNQNGPGKYSFPQSSIESITLGMRISYDDEEGIKKAVIKANLNIPIYKVLPPFDTYSLHRRLVFSPT